MNATILVVEDNKDNIKLMRYLLESRGYEPLMADSGAAGVEVALEASPDLVLMDIQMPIMDGYDAAAAIGGKADGRQIPLVAVTAFAMEGDKERILSSGFDGYITKPIRPEGFVDQVEAFLPAELRAVENGA